VLNRAAETLTAPYDAYVRQMINCAVRKEIMLMPNKYSKSNIRGIKTKKSIFTALSLLLNRLSFAEITVIDVCRESNVSRNTFYRHFKNKWDLLEQWLCSYQEHLLLCFYNASQFQIASRVSSCFNENFKIIENLIKDADDTHLKLLLGFLLPKTCGQSGAGEQHPAIPDNMTYNFIAGGIFSIVFYHVNERCLMTDETAMILAGYISRLTIA